MHELSIVESFLKVAIDHAEKAEAEKIVRINIVVGELSGVVEDSVDFYFNFLSKNSIASEAEINFTQIKTLLRCRNCGEQFYPERDSYQCPKCDDPQVDIIAGRELYVDSIEVE